MRSLIFDHSPPGQDDFLICTFELCLVKFSFLVTNGKPVINESFYPKSQIDEMSARLKVAAAKELRRNLNLALLSDPSDGNQRINFVLKRLS